MPNTRILVISCCTVPIRYTNGCPRADQRKRVLRRKAQDYGLTDGVLYRLSKTGERQRVVPCLEERKALIADAHDMRGHLGRDKCLGFLQRAYYWEGMAKDVKDHIECCHASQTISPQGFSKNKAELHPLPITSVWHHVEVDLISLPTSLKGNDYLLTLVDLFSKWVEAVPIVNRNAITIARELYSIFLEKGFPSVISSDQGREFVNETLEELMRINKVEKRVSSAYHPQSQGLVERFNQTLQQMLLKCSEDDEQRDWDIHAPEIIYSYNTVPQDSKKMQPFTVMYGSDPLGAISEGGSAQNVLDSLMEQRRKTGIKVKENVAKAQERQKRQYRAKHKPKRPFAVGDEILLYNARRATRKGSKNEPRRKGPYQIIKCLPKSLYRLSSIESGQQLQRAVSATLLKHYQQRVSAAKDSSSPRGGAKKVLSKRQFLPPSVSDRKDVTNALGIISNIEPPPVVTNITLGTPKKVHRVLGDGNCFFRALSYIISVSESHHKAFRDVVVRAMSSPSLAGSLQRYMNRNVSKYISEAGIGKLGTWATAAEIIATAALLKFDIEIYAQYSETWSWHRYRGGILANRDGGNVEETGAALYLQHTRGDHFDVVEGV